MASGTNWQSMSGLPEKMRKACVCRVMPLVSCAGLSWHFLRSTMPCSRDGSFQPGSGTLAEAFRTDATFELSDVSESSSENKLMLCLAEDERGFVRVGRRAAYMAESDSV